MCKYKESCQLYLAGKCINDPLENQGTTPMKDIVKCKMVDLKQMPQ